MIAWGIRRPAVIWAASAALLLAGLMAFTRLALATRTTVELPTLSVSVSWPGASAELNEMYVASPVEAAIQGVRGIRKTRSESTDEGVSLTVELQPGTDVQLARLGILERLELLRREFPPGVTPPRVSNFVPTELQEEPLLLVTMGGPYTPGALQKLADEVLEPRLSAIPGVAGLTVSGGAEFGVSVSYNARLLRQLGIEGSDIARAVSQARSVAALGRDARGATERPVSLRDQPGAIAALEALPVRGPGGRVFRVGELASVRPQEDQRGRFFRINGQPAIALRIARLPDADAIRTARSVRATLDDIRRGLPTGVTLTVVNDDSVELREQLTDLLIRGGIAFAAVILVLLFFLRDVRATGLVMFSAALAVAGTALGLFLFRIPANLLTLAGLAMGIGILVQNGLIVAERLGTTPDTEEGRANAARRIAPAVVGASLTTAVVLFPFLYLQGDARAAFMPFASAFVLGLGWSIVTAVVMIPALAAGHRVHEAGWPRARRVYLRTLRPLVRFRRTTLLLTLAALGGLTWVFVKKVPRFAFGGFGSGQRTVIQAFISFPRGSDPASLDAAMRELEHVAVGQPGVERVSAQSYGAFGAGMQVLYRREDELSALPLQLEEALTQRAVFIGGASVSVRGQGPGFASGLGGASIATFRIRVLGYSFSGVERLALDLKERLEGIPRVRDVDINSSSFFGNDKASTVTVTPDRAALARFGLTARDFALAAAREMRSQSGAIRLEIGDEELPVTVQVEGSNDRSLDELSDALVSTPTGAPVRLSALAAVSEAEGLSAISREDQQYVRFVAYEFRGPNKLAQRTHDAFMASVTLPPGYSVADAGFGRFEPDESEKGLWLVFAIGIALVVLSVAIVFDSVWGAAAVFLSLPVSLGGVMAAFWLFDAAFTREAAVGVILVIGLAVNQSILVVDAALERRRRLQAAGRDRRLDGGMVLRAALDRSGMVVLVTLTSLASLVPLAVGVKTTSLFGAIALATAGGTVAGTLGAMFIVPPMLAGRPRRRSQRRIPPTADAPPSAPDVGST
ncbi:MAG: efflux RND transporter permease subunit [Gemmatimonadaceae bacterium]|nr:efflux RND transporter permease subunit [Gemmatimonadaceae bacterium]